MKNNVIIRGVPWGYTGYATITRGLIKSLYKAIPDNLLVHPIFWATQQDMFVDEEMKEILHKCKINEDGDNVNVAEDSLLCLQLPDDIIKMPLLKNTYVYTMLETSSIPQKWVDILNKIQGTMVPCNGNVATFRNSGVNKLACIPPATSMIFNTEKRENGLVLKNLNKFNILSFGQANPRKNLAELISAYCDVFGNNSNVTLFLKVQGRGYSTIEMYNIANEIKKFKSKKNAKIILLYDNLTDNELADIYRSMDLFVNTSFGESWDYPSFDALNCGIPAINTGFLGSDMYMPSEFKVKYNMVDVQHPNKQVYEDGQKWAKIDSMDLRMKMMYAYNNKKKYKKLAMEASERLKTEYSWDKSAEIFLNMIKGDK